MQIRSPFKALPNGASNPLGTVLAQEIDRYNTLLRVASSSLHQLLQALQGSVVTTDGLEAVARALASNRVPAAWATAAYASLKPLGSWMRDLGARVGFMAAWLELGQPHSFSLSSFFFPQSFITALLQRHARQTLVAIDRLSLAFEVTALRSSAGVTAVRPRFLRPCASLLTLCLQAHCGLHRSDGT